MVLVSVSELKARLSEHLTLMNRGHMSREISVDVDLDLISGRLRDTLTVPGEGASLWVPVSRYSRRDLAPAVSDRMLGAVFAPGEGFGNPLRGMTALLRLAKAHGARVLRGAEVTAIERAGSGWTPTRRWARCCKTLALPGSIHPITVCRSRSPPIGTSRPLAASIRSS